MTTTDLTKETKRQHLQELSEARQACHWAVIRAKSAWEDHVLSINLVDNDLLDESELKASYERAENARRAVQPYLAAMKAKQDACLAMRLDLGVDRGLTMDVVA